MAAKAGVVSSRRDRATARKEEFEALLEEHRGIVFKLAYAYSRDAGEREDLVQEICLQLWRAFPRYDPRRRFSTWMYRVALNTVISSARARRLREERSATLTESLTADVPHPSHPVDGRFDLWRAVHRLGELDRALLVLYLDDRSHREIADVLGLSETNVGTKLNRLKLKMRRDLAPETKEESVHGAR